MLAVKKGGTIVKVISLAAVLAVVFAPGARAAQDERLTALSATLSLLPHFPAGEETFSGPYRGATPELTVAKRQLRDWIDAELQSESKEHNANVSAKEFAARLNGKLHQANIQGVRDIRAWSYSRLLAVVTSFPIACGLDESFYAWAWTGHQWKRVVGHETNDYEGGHYSPQVDYGMEGVHFSPASSKNEGELYLLRTSVGSGCNSGWPGRNFQLYRVTPANAAASLMVDGSVFAFVMEGTGETVLTPDRLIIEYTGHERDPRKTPFQARVRMFRLQGAKATPVSLAAADPEDFVEQWLSSSWEQSAAVTSELHSHTLEQWHHDLHRNLEDDLLWASFASAVQCRDDSTLWQYGLVFVEAAERETLDDIEYSTNPCDPTVSQTGDGERVAGQSCTQVDNPDALNQLRKVLVPPRVVYFLVRKIEPYLYTMEDIRDAPPADCAATGK
jgi:hypothetical protein